MLVNISNPDAGSLFFFEAATTDFVECDYMSLCLICLAIWLRDLISLFDYTANIQLHIFYIKDDSFVCWQNFHLLIFHLHLSERERCHSLSGLWHWLVVSSCL